MRIKQYAIICFLFWIFLAIQQFGKDSQNFEGQAIETCTNRFSNLIQRENTVIKIVETISKARVLDKPYKHVLIDDFLPAGLLNCAILCFPSYHRWSSVKKNRGKERKTLDLDFATREAPTWLSEKSRSLLKPMESDFWESYNLILTHSEVTNAWVKKFEGILKNRNFISEPLPNFTSAVQSGIIYPKYNLQLDSSKYAIRPHNDGGTLKLITLLLYMPRQNEPQSRDAGTLVLEKKKPNKVASGIQFYDEESNTVKIMNPRDKSLGDKIYIVRNRGKYRANSLIAFGICENSWHAVPRQHLKERRLIPGFISFLDGYITDVAGQC